MAGLEPEIAPKSSAAVIVVSGRPPGTRPISAETQSMRRFDMPPWPITPPAKMNPGTASSTSLSIEPVNPCTTTSIDTPFHAIAAIASERKIIHIGTPARSSRKAPRATSVSIEEA